MANLLTVAREVLVYRGREGQWAWAIHRAAGVGVMLFLAIHILDIFALAFGPEVFDSLLFLYKGPLARLLEVLLVFGLLYHALNGLRIIIIDFWPATMRYQRQMWYVFTAIFIVIFLPAAFFMLLPLLQGRS